MRLTDAKIRAMKPSKERKILWEDGGTGMGIRIFPSGVKSFIFMYRFDGKARMMTIGKYPQVGLASARSKAVHAKEKLLKGIDPGQELIKEKKADRDAFTVKDLVEEYLEKWAKPRKRSWKEDQRILHKDIVSRWGRRKAKNIQRRDIVILLDELVDRGAPIQANRTLAVTRKMFNFAVGRSILEASPCVSIDAPSKENRRDRALSEDEILKFWDRLDHAKMAEGTKLALRLQLVTAQRKGEIAGAEWTDFDLSRGWWTIPAEKAKNNVLHRVPLSPLALNLLQEIKEHSGESRWLFPGARGDGHITEPAIDHALRNNFDVFEMDHFVPHDLRRTAASQMTGSGVSRLTVSKILNHVDGGVTAVYDRHTYDAEKRQALGTWARKLESILTGQKAKIVNLKRK